MSRREGSTRIAKSSVNQENQFQTPDKPQATTPARSTASGISKKTFPSSSSSSLSRRKNRSPFSSTSTSRFSNTTLFSSPSDQNTLTQIAFVTKPQEPELDDGRFDYIEENEDENDDRNGARHDTIVIDSDSEPQNENEDDSINTDSRLPRARHVPAVRFEGGSSLGSSTGSREVSVRKQRRITRTNSEAKRARARRTNGNKKKSNSNNNNNNNDKKKSKDNTLTQMKFVHPIIHIKSDGTEDGANLDYISCSPRKDESKEFQESQSDDKIEGDLSQDTVPQQDCFSHKRRRFDGGFDHSSTALNLHTSSHEPPPAAVKKEDATNTEGPLPRNPITPQKTRKFEIPSSQSPESPGLAVISSPQFRSSIRSSLKKISPIIPRHNLREERSPTSRARRNPSMLNPYHTPTIRDNTVSASSLVMNSTGLGQRTNNDAGPDSSPKVQELSTESEPFTSENNDSKSHQIGDKIGTFGRDIVYETDAESDYDDIGNELPDSNGSQREQEAIGASQLPTNTMEDPLVDDSQGHFPPAIPSDADIESSLFTSEIPMSSNASICYRRQQQSTQFPAEPIPVLNTQKIAELFPQENDTTGTSQSQPPRSTKPEVLPSSPTQTQSPTQPQRQSQDLEKLSTEIVPESSPVAQRDINESVVQVESSQPADRLNKQTDATQSFVPQGILSKSRLLPSSLMESVAVPMFWMGSQDSVGEPYDLPEG